MEIREYAEQVLFGTLLEEKLSIPEALSDENPGNPVAAPLLPSRPASLVVQPGKNAAPFPKLTELENQESRGRLLHFFANHELLATEIMALVLLRFPDAPKAFRRGVAKTLREEQEHTRLYIDRMRALDCEFGQYPVTGFFWQCLRDMASPMEYVSGLPLTFEQANLDYSYHFRSLFETIGDQDSAQLMDRIYRDEIAHVAYGLKWLRTWKSGEISDWEAHRRHLRDPLSPRRAKAAPFNRAGRQRAGLGEDYLSALSLFARSKGRRSDVYVWHPFAEWYLARGASFTPTKRQRDFARDLGSLPQFLGSEDDIVMVEQRPRPDFLLSLKNVGLPVPEFAQGDCELSSSEGGGETRPLGAFKPWAKEAVLFEEFRHLKSSFSNFERPTSPYLFSKKCGVKALAALLHDERGSGGWLCPEQDVGRVVDSVDSTLNAVNEWRSAGFRALVVKADFCAAGSRLLRLWEPAVSERQVRWLERLFHAGETAIIEPWHERVLDFSAQYEMGAEGIRLLGFARMHNDHRGQFLASSVMSQLTKRLPRDVARFLHGPGADRYKALFQRLGKYLARLCGEHDYQGPLGVDAYVAKGSEDHYFLKPVVEINPRFTMGRLAWQLRRWGATRQDVVLAVVSVAIARRLGINGLSLLPEWLAAEFPIALAGGATPRVQSGGLCLTDASVAREAVAVAWFGDAVGKALPLLDSITSAVGQEGGGDSSGRGGD